MTSRRRTVAQDEVDRIGIAEADDLTKWDPPLRVMPREVVVLEFDSKTIQKAKRLAERNRLPNYRSWSKMIISERIKKEEKAVSSRISHGSV